MTLLPMDIIKLLVALFLGGLIGAEREYRDKAAGFRTIILICVGAALFTGSSTINRDHVQAALSKVTSFGGRPRRLGGTQA
jgi:putative Mg2+ transporter-C (MgtC) family protein